MKRLIRLISLMLLMAIIFSFAGCNTNESDIPTVEPSDDVTSSDTNDQDFTTEDVTEPAGSSPTENGVILKYRYGDILITVSPEDEEKFMEIMDSAVWQDGKWKVVCPFLLIPDGHTMYFYCPETGLVEDSLFYSATNKARYFYLTDEQREFVNSLITPYYPDIHAL